MSFVNLLCVCKRPIPRPEEFYRGRVCVVVSVIECDQVKQ